MRPATPYQGPTNGDRGPPPPRAFILGMRLHPCSSRAHPVSSPRRSRRAPARRMSGIR